MSGGFNRSDIVDFFLVEASEHLQVLNDGLLSLEENSEDVSVVDEIFRSAHTIKGSAAMLGFHVISKLAHKMEDLLGKIRSRELELTESITDLLLQTVDTLTLQVENIPTGQGEEESILLMFNDLYAEFLGTPEAEAPQHPLPPSPPSVTDEEELPPGEEEISHVFEDFPDFEDLQPLPEPEEEEPTEAFALEPVPEEREVGEEEDEHVVPEISRKATARSAHPRGELVPQKSMVSASDKKIVKVEVEGLNLLMNLVGELVINRTRLDQRIAYVNEISAELNFSRERLLKVIRDFKEKYEFGQVDETQTFDMVPDRDQDVTPQLSASDLLDGFFELEFDKYDDFNILSRTLMEIGSDISEIMNQLTEFFDQFEEESSHIRRTTNDLQEEITNIRMVPVGQLFSRFHRTVRDVAKQESKVAVLKTSGEDARLDKTVINEMADPLMHLIRNSVSHGIELPDVREARSKPREGTVMLKALKEGDNIIIEVSDDGNGINIDRVRESIAEKGLRSLAEIEKMTDDEVIQYIFAPGFSTKKDVSAISGRGVGMDVVKTNIAKLGGTIEIKTEAGKGTKFSIKLPLTLIIYAALLVKCGDQEFAISLTSVEETARIPAHHIHNVGRQEVIKLRDQVLPIRRLRDILRLNHSQTTSQQAYMPVIVVRSADQTLALIVDELIGRETIVIKPLGEYLKKVKLFSGATISGEGKVRLILDISTIIDQELSPKTPLGVASARLELNESFDMPAPEPPEEKTKPELLLVDDSISIRKIIGMMLGNAGYKVDVAVDGVEAIEKISTTSYDLILTDLEMPRMHGYELIAEVRSGGQAKDIPIIVLTSRAGDKHYSKAIELGANDYIVKPVDEDTLLNSVRKLLSHRKAGIQT
ncbi:cheA signal transduction histidine kinase [Candidatus Vecturithrix granuli]|uniref:histidine kinase n=1 Tax=Vecturithrix granuli TaxID=1499967 RepID=A0A0S6W9H0_VECG1|nr:cheA signal transduction histidine kinase [Candidatus Vecturithrix granuli]